MAHLARNAADVTVIGARRAHNCTVAASVTSTPIAIGKGAPHRASTNLRQAAVAPRHGAVRINGTTSLQQPSHVVTLRRHSTQDRVMRTTKTKRKPREQSNIELFKQLKQEQIENVKVLIKAVPRMIAALAHETSARDRQKLEEKIGYCIDRVRFCYWLYTDAVELLGPKPKWLTARLELSRFAETSA